MVTDLVMPDGAWALSAIALTVPITSTETPATTKSKRRVGLLFIRFTLPRFTNCTMSSAQRLEEVRVYQRLHLERERHDGAQDEREPTGQGVAKGLPYP